MNQRSITFFISLVFLFAYSGTSLSQNREFVGPGSQWDLNGNWSPSDYPNTTTETAIIDAGGSFNVTITDTFNTNIAGLVVGINDSLTLADSANLELHSSPFVNNGEIFLSGQAATTSIRFDFLDVTLLGSGQISLSGPSFITGITTSTFTPTTTLTNGPEHVIRGGGQIDAVAIVNQGMIIADALQILEIDISESTSINGFNFLNQGLLLATDGGILELEDGLYGNTDGVIRADDQSSVDLVTFVQVDGGVFQTEGTGRIRVPNGQDGTLSGLIVNQGVIEVQGFGGTTDLNIFSNTTINGSGEIRLSGSSANIRGENTPSSLTIGPEMTVSGGGDLGLNSLSVINLGNVIANSEFTPLLVDPPSVVPGPGDFCNRSTMSSENGGTLILRGGVFDNQLGVIIAGADSTVDIQSEGIILGGTLSSIDNGRFQVSTNAGFDGMINNLTTLEQVPNSTAEVVDDTTFTGTGVYRLLGTNSNFRSDTNFDVLNNSKGHTFAGSGLITAVIINDGVFRADDSSQPMEINPPDVDLGEGVDFINSSTLEAVDGGVLELVGGRFGNSDGRISAGPGSMVILGDNADIGGGELVSVDDGLFIISNGDCPIFRGIINNNANIQMIGAGFQTRLEIAADTVIAGAGSIRMSNNSVQNGIVGISTISILENGPNHSIIGSGQISSLRVSNFGTIESQDDVGLTIMPSALQLPSGGNFVNQALGRVVADGGGGVRFDSGQIINRAGGEINVKSVIEVDEFATLTNEPGGLVTGDGFIVSDVAGVALQNGGTLSPGDPIGLLSIFGDCLQVDSAEIQIKIGKDDHDRLFVQGELNLDGQLTILISTDAEVSADDSLEIIDAGSFTGNFSNVVQGRVNVESGGSFAVMQNDNKLILQGYVPLLGDLNGDGVVSLLDIAPLVDLILSGEYDAVADFNFDDDVDLLDVALFVEALQM